MLKKCNQCGYELESGIKFNLPGCTSVKCPKCFGKFIEDNIGTMLSEEEKTQLEVRAQISARVKGIKGIK